MCTREQQWPASKCHNWESSAKRWNSLHFGSNSRLTVQPCWSARSQLSGCWSFPVCVGAKRSCQGGQQEAWLWEGSEWEDSKYFGTVDGSSPGIFWAIVSHFSWCSRPRISLKVRRGAVVAALRWKHSALQKAALTTVPLATASCKWNVQHTRHWLPVLNCNDFVHHCATNLATNQTNKHRNSIKGFGTPSLNEFKMDQIAFFHPSKELWFWIDSCSTHPKQIMLPIEMMSCNLVSIKLRAENQFSNQSLEFEWTWVTESLQS